MAKGVIMVFSNPASPEVEDEYNQWYNGIHYDELTAPDGVRAARRFRVSETQVPGNDAPVYQYLSIYELDDIERDFPAMRGIKTTPSDAIHADRRQVIFEEIHNFRKNDIDCK